VLSAVALLVPVAVACEEKDEEPSSTCQAREASQYPDLEQVADQALAGVMHTLSRLSGCEDYGRPEARIMAAVSEWGRRRQVVQHLQALGWDPLAGSTSLASPDERYTAQPVVAREPDAPKYMAIYFASAGSR
jgi:hypothetical protein